VSTPNKISGIRAPIKKAARHAASVVQPNGSMDQPFQGK
jgi:hypothetical protein